MVNQTPAQPEYKYDWQNPDRKKFEIGRVVSETFKALLGYPVQIFVLTFFGVGIPMMIVSLWPLLIGADQGINLYDPNWIESFDWEGMLALFAGVYLIYMLISVVMIGALIHISVKALSRQKVILSEALKTGLRLFFPMLGLMIIYIFGVMVGLLLLIIPGVFIMLGWALAFNIRVVEGGSVTDALSRSWEISKGYKRWLLLAYIIFTVLGAVIGLVFQIPVLFFGNSQMAFFEGGSTSFWIANAIATGLTQMVTLALSYVGLTAAYMEVRRVREGLIIESVADIFS